MNYKRKIYQKLLDWKNEPVRNSALLIEGARRVGKSTIVEEFAKNEYDDYILIDFMYETDEMKNLFKNLKDLDSFFANFFLLAGKSLTPHKGIIIFDEVQFCPLARQGIKKFVKDGRYDYIETGSLLSIRDNTENISIPSEERRIEMFPMDYEEFLWAFNKMDSADLIRKAYNDEFKITDDVHNMLMNDFRKYLCLGGMPKVLSIFQETNSYISADNEKRDIIKLYKDDLLKHDLKYKTVTRKIYDSIPSQLSKSSSRYLVSSSFENKRASDIALSLFDLNDSKTVNTIYNCTDPMLGFELSKSDGLFKIYPNDVGLLFTYLYSEKIEDINNVYKKAIFDNLNSDFGRVFEGLVAQNLVANGYKPYYHTFEIVKKTIKDGEEVEKVTNYEIDFMINKNGKPAAIEVKSGKNFTTSSLDNINVKYPQIKFDKIVCSVKKYERYNSIINIPLYMIFCL